LRLEAAHAGAGIEHAAPLEAGVDDRAHSFDREARLGDVGREHDLAPARARRVERRVLLGGRQLAVERQHVDVRTDVRLAEPRLHAANLARARQEYEQVGGRFRERAAHDARDDGVRRLLARRTWTRQQGQPFAHVMSRHRMHARRVLDHGRAAEQPRDRRAVERRRHRQQAERGRDVPLRIERERETDVRVQAALVELVEDHGRDAAERRIALQHPREYAFRDDLEARRRAHACLQPHAVADGRARALAERRGHPRGDGSRGEAARLEQDDLLAARPRLLEQRERHDGALARAGRRDEHRVLAVGQRGAQPRQGFVDRQAGAHEARILPGRASEQVLGL
jgi:hypothetical protein